MHPLMYCDLTSEHSAVGVVLLHVNRSCVFPVAVEFFLKECACIACWLELAIFYIFSNLCDIYTSDSPCKRAFVRVQLPLCCFE